jgi:hypothetical protein
MKNNSALVLTRIVAAALAMLAVPAAQAAAPAAKTQAPGYYRTPLGDFEITTVLDGALFLDPLKLLTNTKPEHVQAMLAKNFLETPVETSVNTFLINTGTKLVLPTRARARSSDRRRASSSRTSSRRVIRPTRSTMCSSRTCTGTTSAGSR